ncbi:hypothetical protein DH2020_023820 [Rehmannia glutinosa]|uniref:BURP domain-containing protein n=1 Tax=Rehmannia glutinosa TaxID=99300 RepID=A0ABR0WB11_REHGL
MDLKPLLCSLMLLHLLILLVILQGFCSGIESKEMAGEIPNRDHNSHANIHIEQVHSHIHHHIDPSTIVFFLLEDLKQGNTIPIYFPNRELSDSFSHLLSKQAANSIPFTSQEIHNILQIFSFPQDSPQAIAIKDTLEECERKPITGETKICATSYESMLDFLQSIFGSKIQTKYFSTTHLTKSNNNAILQKYTIMGIHEISAPKIVACHTMPYPYAVFYCHYQESQSKVYKVLLSGENGDRVEAIAVCHMDTSHWGRNHVSFKVLGIEPGSSPVCHFFPADNFVWVPLD